MSVPRLPTGTVTFLFTDIEGSTRLWQRPLGHGDSGLAARFFDECFTLSVAAQDAAGAATSLEGLAGAAGAGSHAAMTLSLLAVADTLRRARGVPRSDADEATCSGLAASARAQLDASSAEAAWAKGSRMPVEDAAARARQLLIDRPAR